MANPKILNYINQYSPQGYSEDQLRSGLQQQGFPSPEIDEAFNELNNLQNPSPESSSQPTETNKPASNIKKRNPAVVILLTLITLGIYGLVWSYLTAKELKENTSTNLNPAYIFLALIPAVGIVFAIIFYWKYSKALNELTGFSEVGMFVLWLLLGPVAMILAQIELNKKA